ncbi:MAG: hypothetical protein KIT58_19540 [Planctomycetota bacterium]|nr:hypothetical protein [Planctomycetota bacterium]
MSEPDLLVHDEGGELVLEVVPADGMDPEAALDAVAEFLVAAWMDRRAKQLQAASPSEPADDRRRRAV